MYLTYDDYMDMGGELDDTAFADYEFEASTIVDWYTFKRIPKWFPNEADRPEHLKRCIYHLMKLLQQLDEANTLGDTGSSAGSESSGAITSQSNDGVSISYNVISASVRLENAEKDKERIVQKYLNTITDSLGRRILYRGLYPGE